MFATSSRRRGLVAASVLGLLAAPLALIAAPAQAASTGLLITEVYGGGGNSGANLNADFVEIKNISASPISLNGKSLQYRSATGTTIAGVAPLSGTVPAGAQFLIQTSGPGANGSPLPTPDYTASGVNMGGAAGVIILANSTTALTLPTGSILNNASVIDLVGYGTTALTFETGPTANISVTTSARRTNEAADGDNNTADFTAGTQTPVACGETCEQVPPPDGEYTIDAIQGTGSASTLVGAEATTYGVVTATYPTGGYNGIYIQTEGTGGGTDATPGASDAVFVFGANSGASTVEIGDYVEVVGEVTEFAGSTQLVPAAGGVTVLDEVVDPVAPLASGLPVTEAQKESHEGELFAPTGPFTVTNTFPTNGFAEIWLAAQDGPLVQGTELFDAQGTQDDAHEAQNVQRQVALDDGASINYLNPVNQDSPLLWLTPGRSIRVGASVTIDDPVIFEFRNNLWKFQPRHQLTGDGSSLATFEDTRPANLLPQEVGGELSIGTFNVLNYFNTTGRDYIRDGGACTFFADREQNPVGVNSCGSPAASDGNGPRGAAQGDDFAAQQAKIVRAINTMDTDIVSLEEIENSVKLLSAADKGDRDDAVKALVAALNDDAGSTRWAAVLSPPAAELPALAEQDTIRNAFIYNPATVEPVGKSRVLTGISAFGNAREPLAQAFRKVGDTNADAFGVIVNHFKSKGSGADDGTGQGLANADRVAQARALADFADQFQASRDLGTVFLTGDFNSYSQEDPMQVLADAGWTNLESDQSPEYSYSFSGRSGSLDHVLVNDGAASSVTGVDIWDINAGESVAYQYSRRNYNVTQFFNTNNVFAASDHNPEIVGFDLPVEPETQTIQILGTNDFHGRIANDPASSAAGAAVMAGAIEELRAQNPNTVFAAAGDLIGASTFESFIANDKPTIDALNAAGLEVSSVGNHEFDQGYDDLVNRVMAPYDETTNPDGGAAWQYLAANVDEPGDADLIPDTWTTQFGDVEVGFVGAVTEHLDELVSPGGMEGVTVTSIVNSTNTAADQLKADGADIVVLLVHEGAPGTDCVTMDDDPTSDFGGIISGVNANVDAIISGHTHLAYNCKFPVVGWEDRPVKERPVVSAGQYGAALNRLRFQVDETGAVTGISQRILNLKQGQTPLYDADADIAELVAEAVADADVLGSVPLGDIAGGFNRAKLADNATENRGAESTLGNLVAEVQRAQTPETVGSAQIAFMNPGGLRADMVGTGTGAFPRELTYKQAATVQPFANTLVNMDLTGAQIKQALEQQWQPAGAARPFLRLGASDGFTYTYDPDAAVGSRITGMWLDGVPVAAGTPYSVTVNSFLATGGDNFGAFAGGANKQDTGVTDLQAMVDYMEANTGGANPALPVDYSQRAVGVNFPAGAPATYAAGEEIAFGLTSLSMTGPGDQTDSAVSVSLDGVELGTAPVTTTKQTELPGFDEVGTASVEVTVPDDVETGPATLVVTGATTGTETLVPVMLEAGEEPEPVRPTITVERSPSVVIRNQTRVRLDVTVSAPGFTVPGSVRVRAVGAGYTITEELVDGQTTFRLRTYPVAGQKTVVIRYLGSDLARAVEREITFRVRPR